jgi:diaminopropionate ammonia-lyase
MMQENLSFFINRTPFTRQPSAPLAPFSRQELEKALNFHRSIPGYAPTPLYSLPALSKRLGVKNIYLKDESQRFGLKAFKALGRLCDGVSHRGISGERYQRAAVCGHDQ